MIEDVPSCQEAQGYVNYRYHYRDMRSTGRQARHKSIYDFVLNTN